MKRSRHRHEEHPPCHQAVIALIDQEYLAPSVKTGLPVTMDFDDLPEYELTKQFRMWITLA